MSDPPPRIPDPLEGHIEPHAGLLQLPPDGQLLYKVMRVEYFLQSVEEGYLLWGTQQTVDFCEHSCTVISGRETFSE